MISPLPSFSNRGSQTLFSDPGGGGGGGNFNTDPSNGGGTHDLSTFVYPDLKHSIDPHGGGGVLLDCDPIGGGGNTTRRSQNTALV
jgi:hypothetical protein